MLEITYQAAREPLLWLLCDLSSATAGTGGKSKSRGIAIQGQVSTPCKPTEPALASHVKPTSLHSFWTQPRLLVQVVWKTGARARPVEDASSTSVSCGVLLPGEGQLGEQWRQRPDLRKVACSSPHKREGSTGTDATSEHHKLQQCPPLSRATSSELLLPLPLPSQ